MNKGTDLPYMEYILYLIGVVFIVYLVIKIRNNGRNKQKS